MFTLYSINCIFVKRIPQALTLTGRLTWLRCTPKIPSKRFDGYFTVKPESGFGMGCYGTGDFTMMTALLDCKILEEELYILKPKLKTICLSNIELHDNEPYIEYVIDIQIQGKHYIQEEAPKQESNTPSTIGHTVEIDIPTGDTLRIMAVHPFLKQGQDNIPPEYMLKTPHGIDLYYPSQRIATDSANSLVFDYNIVDEWSAVSNPMLINTNSNSLNLSVRNGRLYSDTTLNILEGRDYDWSFTNITHIAPMRLDHTPYTLIPFDLVLSPLPVGTFPSWLMMKGGASYCEIVGSNIDFSIGNKEINLSIVDRLVIEGDYFVSLEFVPPALPIIKIEGQTQSITINQNELLQTRWESWDANVKGPIFGALLAIISGVIASILTAKLVRKRQNKSK